MAVETGGELTAVDEEGHRAIRLHDREAERQRGVRHVAAANVEQPSDRLRHRQYCRGRALANERLADPCTLVGGALAREALGLSENRRQRRRRPSAPNLVERVLVDRLQRRAGAL